MKIKRPLFISVLSIFVVIYAINTMPRSAVYVSLALFALFIIIHRKTKARYTSALVMSLVSMFSSLVYFEIYSTGLKADIEEYSTMQNIVLEGTVTSEARTSASKYYIISADNINSENARNFSVIVYTGENLSAGDRIVISGKYKPFTLKSNYMYNYSRGVFGYFYPDKIEISGEQSGLTFIFREMRTKLTDRARKIFSYDTVGVALAMGIGDKNYLSDTVVNAFSFTGISHVLVVSGLHVGFVVIVLNMLVGLLPISKKIKNIITAVFIFLFMGIIGFTPSIIRAGGLIIAVMIGRNHFLETDNYTTLALIVLITLFINPYTATNASLLLSYGAYFGVITAAEIGRANEYNKVKVSLLMTTFAVLYTAPVMAVLGMDVTLLSPFFNLLLSPLVMMVCVLSLFLPVLYYLPCIGTPLAAARAPAADFLIRTLVDIAVFIGENFSAAMVNLGRERTVLIIFVTLLATVFSYIQTDNIKIRKIVIFAVPVITFLCYNHINKNIVSVKVFDGSSEPSYIISYKDKNYLVLTENMNRTKFKNRMESENIDSFSTIIYCPEKYEECSYIESYTENTVTVEKDQHIETEAFTFIADIEKRTMAYVIDIAGTKFVFNHKNTDLSAHTADFYFFGSDKPADFTAENSFYFYPVIKANREMAVERGTTELYGPLTIKINLKTGDYTIIKDVKNFGSQL